MSKLTPGAFNRMQKEFDINYRSHKGVPWTLPSGTIVDSMMYNHTISLGAESSLHSFIIDTGNSATLKALGSVEDQDLMKTFDRKKRPLLPMWIKKEIAVYALEPAALEEALSHGWACAQVDHSQDPDPPHPDRLRTFRYRLYCTILSVWTLYQARRDVKVYKSEQLESFGQGGRYSEPGWSLHKEYRVHVQQCVVKPEPTLHCVSYCILLYKQDPGRSHGYHQILLGGADPIDGSEGESFL
jgi:hypothetical protein